MKVYHPLILLAAIALMLLPSTALAVITHYNVDSQTLPGGPAVLTSTGAPTFGGGVITYPLLVTNTGATTLTDVRFLLQFVNADNSILTFTDATDTWADGTNTYSFINSGILTQIGGGFPMTDTNAPLTFPGYGTVAATDTVPQVLVGNLGPGGTFAFSIQANSTTAITDVVGTFVATPEPSTLALLGLGAVALVAARRFRKQA
jgi:hypothetical protein